MKKYIAVFLLSFITLILSGSGTGLHIHHESHGLSETVHAPSTGTPADGHCASHCAGETFLEHFFENHGSLFNGNSEKFQLNTDCALIITFRLPKEKTNTRRAVPPNLLSLYHQHSWTSLSKRGPPLHA